MSSPLAICRRSAALLAPWLAVIAFVACLTSAVHHHHGDGPHPQCAVCSHGAAPAVPASASAAPSAPFARAERAPAPALEAPLHHPGATALSRAPPPA